MSIDLPAFKSDFGAWLRRSREFAGLRVESLAQQIGVSPQVIYQWELGRTVPTLPNAILLSHALGAELPIPRACDLNAPISDDPDDWANDFMVSRDGLLRGTA